VSPSELKLLPGLSLDQAVEALRRGEADFIHLLEPAVEHATNKLLDTKPQVVERFLRGYAKARQWLAASDVATVGEAVAPFFPERADVRGWRPAHPQPGG